MPWDLNSDRPIYTQIIEQMELKICSGVYPLGSQLPSVRDLAREASVNPNTMQRALSKLEETGLLYSIRTSGRFVTEDEDMVRETKMRLANEYAEDFLTNMMDLGFSREDILSAVTSLVKEMEE